MASNQGGNKGSKQTATNPGGNQGNARGGSSQSATSNRGFASMDPEKQRAIASEGGRAAHASGHAHEFTSEEARAAGKLSHGGGNRQSGPSVSGGKAEGNQAAGSGNEGGGGRTAGSGGEGVGGRGPQGDKQR